MRHESGIYLERGDFIKAQEVLKDFGKLAVRFGNVGIYLMQCGCKLRTIEHEDIDGLSVIVFSDHDKPLAEDISNVLNYNNPR